MFYSTSFYLITYIRTRYYVFSYYFYSCIVTFFKPKLHTEIFCVITKIYTKQSSVILGGTGVDSKNEKDNIKYLPVVDKHTVLLTKQPVKDPSTNAVAVPFSDFPTEVESVNEIVFTASGGEQAVPNFDVCLAEFLKGGPKGGKIGGAPVMRELELEKEAFDTR